MGEGYKVDYGALEQTADDAHALAADAPGATEGMRLNRVVAALPGSLSAGRAAKTDAEWVTSAEQLTTDLLGFATALDTTARNYRAAEDAATESATGFFGGLP